MAKNCENDKIQDHRDFDFFFKHTVGSDVRRPASIAASAC